MRFVLFWLTILIVALAQLGLCHEALVCRGHPPLSEFGLYKQLAASCLFWVPAVFGDRTLRLRGLIVTSMVTTCLYVMISANGTLRPSVGHLLGVRGILQAHFCEILIYTPLLTPVSFTIMYLPERVFGDAWRALWLMPSEV